MNLFEILEIRSHASKSSLATKLGFSEKPEILVIRDFFKNHA